MTDDVKARAVIRYGSLFTGAGGLDMAVHALWPDAELSWWSEVDRHAADVFAPRLADGAPNLGDVEAVDWTAVEPVDVLVGGFPCQDISHAGKGAGIKEGTRSGLWFRFADAIGVLRPRHVLLENVSAILVRGGTVVVGDLAALGYDVRWEVVRASDVGAPHRRARWFAVAYDASSGRGGQAIEHDGDTAKAHHRASVPDEPDRGPVRPRPERLMPTPVVSDSKGAVDPATRDRKDGGLSELVQFLLPAPAGRTTRRTPSQEAGSHGKYLSVEVQDRHWGDYAPAIARWEQVLGRPAPAPTDDKGRLSPQFVEWMMGWPDGWTEGASRAQRLKMLGNGVVPRQAIAAYGALLYDH